MPTEPQSKASSRFSAAPKIAFAKWPSGKATMSSTPHHQGSNRARMNDHAEKHGADEQHACAGKANSEQ